MKGRLLELVGRLLLATGLIRWVHRGNRDRLLVVMYHGVRADDAGYDNWCQLPESRFRWQLDYLRRYHRVVPVSRIVGDEPLPPMAAAITFDDGYRNNASRALPLLRERGLPAAIFLVTETIGSDRLLWPEALYHAVERSPREAIDSGELGLGRVVLRGRRAAAYGELIEALKVLPRERKDRCLTALIDALGPLADGDEAPYLDDLRLMDWATVRSMQAEGLIEFGAHTRHHEILSRLDDADLRDEVIGSCRRVAEELEPATGVSFAYPNGRPQDYDERSIRALEEAGATMAFTTESGLNDAETDRFKLRRISVGADMTPGRFVLACSGLLDRLRGSAA